MVEPTIFGSAAEAALPQTVTQHRNMTAMWAVFRCGEGASGNDRSAEQREVSRGDMDALHLFRMVAASDIQSGTAEIVRRDLLENARLLMPDIELRDVRARKRSPVRWCSSSRTSDCGSG